MNRLRTLGVTLLCLLPIGCGVLARHGPVDPSLADFVLPDTIAMAGARLDQLRATPLYRKLEERGRLPRFDRFRTEFGFDPGKDMRQLLLASDGQNALAIGQLSQPAQPPLGLPSSAYHGYTIYTRDSHTAMASVGHKIVLGGETGAVQAAIDRYKSGRGGAPRDLMARAESLPPDAQIWAVVSGWRGLPPDEIHALGNFGNVDRVLRLVDSGTLTVDFRSGLHAAFKGDSRNDTDAKSLADSLSGLVLLARMGVSRAAPASRADLIKALEAIQVKQQGRAVLVNIDIPEDLAERFTQ